MKTTERQVHPHSGKVRAETRHPSLGLAGLIILAGLGLSAGAAFGAPLAQSTFGADAEGWSVTGDAESSMWDSATGNPPGSFKGVDAVLGGTWYFVAPAKFRGDKSAAYGETLSYDIWITSTDSPTWNDACISLIGPLTLYYRGLHPPKLAWTHFEVLLTETAGWKKTDGQTPTEQEMQNVLGGLTALHIRGEYKTGADYAYLDNVVMTPEPATMALLALGGLAMLLRKRR